MKNKLIVVGLIVVAMAVLVKVGMVLADNGYVYAGTIKEVCKVNGGILMDKNNCPGGSQKWLLGDSETSGGGTINIGKVKFVYYDAQYTTIYTLDNEGKVWALGMTSDGDDNWNPDTGINNLPEGVKVDDLVTWTRFMFVTKDGRIWHANTDGDWLQWVEGASLMTIE